MKKYINMDSSESGTSGDNSQNLKSFKKMALQRQMTVAEHRRNKKWMLGGSCLVITGILFVILGILIQFAVFPIIVENMVYDGLRLEPNTDEWDAFVG